MSKKNDIDIRMKDYESCADIQLPRRIPMLMRIDGKNFHTKTKRWKCQKPFDNGLTKAMQETALYLCSEVSGAGLAYTQSDEISIAVFDNRDIYSQPWLDKRIQKVSSITASFATKKFNFCLSEFFGISGFNELADFDCRVWVVPDIVEVINYFIWRQQDCTRNSIYSVAFSKYSSKQLLGKNSSEKQDMLMEVGINWNDYTTVEKRGTCIIKKPIKIMGKSGVYVIRNKWKIDKDIPIFTKDKDYIINFIDGTFSKKDEL